MKLVMNLNLTNSHFSWHESHCEVERFDSPLLMSLPPS